MPIIRTPIMSSSGVKLIQVETIVDGRVTDLQYRVTTLRRTPSSTLADRALAETAFRQEVEASKSDPIVLTFVNVGSKPAER